MRAMILCDEMGLAFIQVPQTGSSAIGAELCERYGGREFLAKHAGIEQAREALGNQFDRYLVVSGIRNPLDQAVSSYFKSLKDPAVGSPRSIAHRLSGTSTSDERAHYAKRASMDFSQFFCEFYNWVYAPRWLTSQRESDYLIRFESIQQGFSEALALTNSPQSRKLPILNRTDRPDRGLQDLFDDKAQARARRVFGPYMSEWGYTFPAEWRCWEHATSAHVSTLMYRAVFHGKKARRGLGRLTQSSPHRSSH